ncbi:polysaccharide deacetylase family protein [Pedobacter cryophilus]|uniref:Polysaccharide deacetylase family protein n=1 Tax=Pedobacter cryophilus TaxID=2571271 RepID=A0A4V5NXE5_9SPHI|nr:polysaccharide deacetylase family protein [Pedobacter cryophilus]TKB98983.1 polysaccharide deacetylase family protein [Pedobacter cryophilus]
MYLIKTPFLLKKLYPSSLIWNKARSHKVIYLTFDDGPIPIVTPWVLKTLKNFNAKATFFCIGENITKYPEIFAQLKADGHTIGNHTFNHLKGWITDDETYLENFNKCQQLTQTNLFRPPYGRIKFSQIQKLVNSRQSEVGSPQSDVSSSQFSIVMWDVLSGDFDVQLSPEKCLKNVLKHTENGSIVVFHDSLKAWKRLEYTLPKALQYWKQKGYEFKTL